MTHAEIYSDASHDAATNCAGWAYAVSMRGIRATRSGVLSDVTIQAAELHAALAGVRHALALGARSATLYIDNTGVIALIEGKTAADAALAAELDDLRQTIALRCVWVRAHVRHGSSGNAHVDALARAALKQR